MALISQFLGILIYIYKEMDTHKRPHVHAVYGGEDMSIAADGEIFAGQLPRKQQKYVEAWVALREDEIKAAWIAINKHDTVITIKGLEG
ncbi:MAG: DUF4160 domain-containing protein [Coriobacteriales bacterium]|jgi:hypothetical protein|nr:DUF4160 domain-containing protein [Coriobacteriales bacterium]